MGSDVEGSILMQRYELGRLLGQGTFAKVYQARNLKTCQVVAIKAMDKAKVLRAGLIDQIKREISVMRIVQHPHIVHLYEVLASKTKIYLILEYVKGGELFKKITKGKLKEEVARKYFQQLISALDFCHSRGAYHRDLKPENLLLDDDENLKISDFGLSALVESKRQDGLLHTMCGTPTYVAPEIIKRKGYDGDKADIWSCGVILFVLMAGYLPFHGLNLIEMYRKIDKSEFKCPNWFSSDVKRLLSRILDPNPATRISIEKIKESQWFRKGFSNKRMGSEETKEMIMKHIKTDTVHDSSEIVAEGKQEVLKRVNLNAFDIIALSSGFDLSGLFDDYIRKKEVRFISTKPATTITSKIEEIAKQLKLKVKKKNDIVLKMEGVKEGRKGVLAIDAQVFEVTPSFHVVEIKKTDGDTLEYQKIWKNDMRPALKDIIWAHQ